MLVFIRVLFIKLHVRYNEKRIYKNNPLTLSYILIEKRLIVLSSNPLA